MLNRTFTPRVSKLNLQLTDISVKLSVTSLQQMFSHHNAEEKTFKSPASCRSLYSDRTSFLSFFFFFFLFFLGAILRKHSPPRRNTQNVGVTFISKAQIMYLKEAHLGGKKKKLERVLNGRAAASQDRERFFFSPATDRDVS